MTTVARVKAQRVLAASQVSISKFTLAEACTQGKAVMLSGTGVKAHDGGPSTPVAGVLMEDGAAGQERFVQLLGPVDPLTFSLSAGSAERVGVTASGSIVRASDPTCVSSPSWVGHVGANGHVFVAPQVQTAGPQGVPGGTSTMSATCSGAVTKGRAVVNVASKVQQAAGYSRVTPLTGVALAAAVDNALVSVQLGGWVAADVVSLGAGVACAVGVDVNGVLVRATDPACVSAPSWVGRCDANGNVFVDPRCESHFNVMDYGAVGDGVADDWPAFRAALDAMYAITTIIPGIGMYVGGATLVIPNGRFRVTKSLKIALSTGQPIIEGQNPITSAVLFDFSQEYATASWGASPWGAGFVVGDAIANSGNSPTFKNFGIYNIASGTPAEREKLAFGAGIAIIGCGFAEIRDMQIAGFKTGILNMGCNNFFQHRVNHGMLYDKGYPISTDGAEYRNYKNGRNSTSLWLAAGGYRAEVVGSLSPNFASIVDGDVLSFSLDYSAPGVDNAAINVYFQAADTTLSAIVARINSAAGRTVCESYLDTYIKIYGTAQSRERGSVNIIGGSAVAKLGFAVARTIGSGAGVGWEGLPSGLTNIVRASESQFNGGWVCIHEEDGANHVVDSNNFNSPGVMGLIEGFYVSDWRNNESEACAGNAYMVVHGRGGPVGWQWHFDKNVLSGFSSNHPANMVTFESDEYGGTPYINGGSIKDNLFLGATGDGRALIVMTSASCLIGFDLTNNIGSSSPLINIDPSYGCVSNKYADGSQKGSFGIGTALPDGHLFVQACGAYVPTWGIRYGHAPASAVSGTHFGVNVNGTYGERGMGVPDGQITQQGVREWFSGRAVAWASGDAPVTVAHIDLDGQEHVAIEVEVSFRESNAAQDAYWWKGSKLVNVYGGSPTLDSADAKEKDRTIGTAVAWTEPTFTTGQGFVDVAVTFPTTPNKAGYWIAHVRALCRTYY